MVVFYEHQRASRAEALSGGRRRRKKKLSMKREKKSERSKSSMSWGKMSTNAFNRGQRSACRKIDKHKQGERKKGRETPEVRP